MQVALQVVTFAELTFKHGKGAVISEALGPVPSWACVVYTVSPSCDSQNVSRY